MNYLAHAYLSFHQPEILAGNMISDYVKGRSQYNYPAGIQRGIRLHRDIDNFTDTHPVTLEAKRIFKPAVGLYAGAFMDVVYDHFLALDDREMDAEALESFAAEVYRQLNDQESLLPERFARMLPYMTSQNWLYNYRFPWSIEKSFEGLARRAKYLSDAGSVFILFHAHYDSLRESYNRFFPDVKKFALERLNALQKQ